MILENQADTGAYPASPNFPAYRFCWFRDGAFIADAMSRAGQVTSAEAFFRWCSDVIAARAKTIEELVSRHRAGEAIDPDEHLHCRYTVGGREGGLPWANFQLDGYGAWLWALGGHASRHRRSVEPFAEGAVPTVRYLSEFWNEPCFDWWEERFGRHTATLASIYAGLKAAEGWSDLPRGVRDGGARAAGEIAATVRWEGVFHGRLFRELGGEGCDASLVACATPFRLLPPDDPVMGETVRAIEAELAHGGVHRYPGDRYYGGGEWPLLAALLGWHYVEVGRTEDARAQLEWVAAQASPDGELPEQVAGHVLVPGGLGHWVRRSGPSASPLLWSHALFITLAAAVDGGPRER